MPRKTPSFHTEQQFALFLAEVNGSLNVDPDSAFEKAVAKLIRNGNGSGNGTGADDPAAITPRIPSAPAVELEAQLPGRQRVQPGAADNGPSRADLPRLLGNLLCTWSSNDSLLVSVMMLLLETEQPSAAVVFAALGTTNARTDLVRHLSLLKVSDPQARATLKDIVDRFDDADRMREEIKRTIYGVDMEKHGGFSPVERQPVDRKCLNRMIEACGNLRRLNRELRDLLPRLQAVIEGRPTAPADRSLMRPAHRRPELLRGGDPLLAGRVCRSCDDP